MRPASTARTAAALVAAAAHAEANIIFGATIDDALGDEVRVTVIAAGFDGGMPKRRNEGTVLRREAKPQQTQAETRAAAQQLAGQTANRSSAERPAVQAPEASAPASRSTTPSPAADPAPVTPARAPRPVQFDDDDLDVPDFLK